MSTRPATRERPIIFDGESVRAILAGRKTVTRRVVKGQGPSAAEMQRRTSDTHSYWRARDEVPFKIIGPVGVARGLDASREVRCPYGEPGGRLWAKETWAAFEREPGLCGVAYRATCEGDSFDYVRTDDGAVERLTILRWRPSIFMPRSVSRLRLEVVSTRVERLHRIDEQDAIREGVAPVGFPRDTFRALWESINGRRAPWESNPLVWRVEFRRVEA